MCSYGILQYVLQQKYCFSYKFKCITGFILTYGYPTHSTYNNIFFYYIQNKYNLTTGVGQS